MAVWQPDPRYQEPPAELRELVDLVLSDLQGTEPIAVRAGWDPTNVWRRPPMRGDQVCHSPRLIFSEADSESRVGWTPEAPGGPIGPDRCWGDDFTPSELAVGLASYLQEQFFPETRAAWSQARPGCPGHPHPAAPRLIDGDAWWTCPLNGHAIAKFGALNS